MKNAAVWIGAIIAGFGVLILTQSLFLQYYTPFGPGPGLLPLWSSLILILLSVLYIWNSVKEKSLLFTDILPKGRELGSVLSTLFALIIFLLLVPYTGFVVAGTLMLLIILIRDFKWYLAGGISFATTFILFFIFKVLLGIPLPVNGLGW